MRRRLPPAGVREELSAFYWDLSRRYDRLETRPRDRWSSTAEALEAGKPVEVPGHMVRAHVHALVRIEPDGRIVPLAWNEATRSYEVLA